jgi:hypothetical protein
LELVFLGGEVPSHRKILIEAGVKNIGVNYWRLVKRGLPVTKDYLLSEKYPSDVRVFVTGGGTQAQAELTPVELEDYLADYEDFVALNDSNIFMAAELDLNDQEILEDERKNFWEPFGVDRFMPVWHKGYPELMSLSERYPHIGLLGRSIDQDLTLSARVRSLQTAKGTEFHAIACANPSNLRDVPVRTASSLAWLSPMMRGETIVWDGTKLVRYQAKQKDEARPRYKGIIEQAGLDFEAILADDPNEVTKLAIYSYLKLEEHLTKMENKKLSDNSAYMDDPGDAETGGVSPDNRGLVMRNEETKTLPVFSVSTKRIIEKDDLGHDTIKDVTVLNNSSSSLRQCNSCFVATNCPAFKPGNNCAYDIPIEVKTKDQLKGLLNAVIEMQGQRVAFARFSEELNGGYPDPNTSKEMDRLFKLVAKMKELEENKEFIRITAERQSSGGVMSALFGDRANTLRELPNGGLNEQETSKIISEGLDL